MTELDISRQVLSRRLQCVYHQLVETELLVNKNESMRFKRQQLLMY